MPYVNEAGLKEIAKKIQSVKDIAISNKQQLTNKAEKSEVDDLAEMLSNVVDFDGEVETEYAGKLIIRDAKMPSNDGIYRLKGATKRGILFFSKGPGLATVVEENGIYKLTHNTTYNWWEYEYQLYVSQYSRSASSWDTTPTASSTKPVTSGGIKTYVDDKSVKMVEMPWRSLKTLRDDGELVPGMQYRITDYVTTTTTDNTSSAGHQFDIIVVADSTTKLNEKARACLHTGDTYFASNDLNAWELWYCLDNDMSRFEWADTTNGKGVIYRMIDEFGNDVPYDFKNVIYEIPKSFIYEDEITCVRDPSLDEIDYGLYAWRTKHGEVPDGWDDDYCFTDIENITTNTTLIKNLAWDTIDGSITDVIDGYSSYTFNKYVNNTNNDQSLIKEACYSNHIKPYYTGGTYSGIRKLNRTIFYSTSNNTSMFFMNTFGFDNHDNMLKGSHINRNTTEDGFMNNEIGDYFSANVIGRNFSGNDIGNYFDINIIGSYFCNNTIYSEFEYNTIGYYFQRNVMLGVCERNKIGDNFQQNTIGNWFSYNISGNDVKYNMFDKAYIKYCIFDCDIKYVSLTCADTVASGSNQIQYVHICSGVKGTSSSNLKVLTVPDRNLTYETEFIADGHNRIIV